jgi:hypothetical protein
MLVGIFHGAVSHCRYLTSLITSRSFHFIIDLLGDKQMALTVQIGSALPRLASATVTHSL